MIKLLLKIAASAATPVLVLGLFLGVVPLLWGIATLAAAFFAIFGDSFFRRTGGGFYFDAGRLHAVPNGGGRSYAQDVENLYNEPRR